MEITANSFDVLIIGAGAAGLMCAIEAGKRGRSVAILERLDSIGKKIRISGGGRCNFTNIIANHESFLSDNPHFSKSALSRYRPSDFIALVEKHGIAYHEKTLGQLFCYGSSLEIITMLRKECETAGVKIFPDCTTQSIKQRDGYIVETNNGQFHSASLVIATGGLSVPKIGATDFGYTIAKQFKIRITRPRPGLVPLLWNNTDRKSFSELSGVSLPVIASCGKKQFRESMLFTHKGLSGPAILQISSYWNPGNAITIDLLPDIDIEKFLLEQQTRKTSIVSIAAEKMPRRIIQRWLEVYFPPKPINQYPFKELHSIAERLHKWIITPSGTEGYEKAEVTVGGIDTAELSSKTMEAKNVPGLYFIGEVVDVTGHLGGYNFQWAWASGYAAGQYV